MARSISHSRCCMWLASTVQREALVEGECGEEGGAEGRGGGIWEGGSGRVMKFGGGGRVKGWWVWVR